MKSLAREHLLEDNRGRERERRSTVVIMMMRYQLKEDPGGEMDLRLISKE